jgi:S-DNA-T family DNA segregation ATPase FtsK/SpoIIIE
VQPFYRPARTHPRPPPSDEVVVAAPPTVPATPGSGWLSALLPLAGCAGSAGLLLLLPGRRPALTAALVAAAVLGSAASGLWPRRLERRARRRARARYLAHLATVRARLDEVAAAQRQAAEFLLPEPERLLALAGRDGRLWERRRGDADFLRARLGRGPLPLACPVRLETAGPLADHDPELLAAAEELVCGARTLAGAPVAVDLREVGVVAVGGQPDRAAALVRALVCHVAVLHAPEDLLILACVTPGTAADWQWLKWLPHARPPSRRAGGCLLAADPDRFGELLGGELRPRVERLARHAEAAPAGGHEPPGPHLLVLLGGFSPRSALARLPAVGELLARAAELGATVLCLAGRGDEPGELGARIAVTAGGELGYEAAGPQGRRLDGVVADQAGQALCEAVARRLAPRRLDRRGGQAAPPDEVRLLDLLGVDLAEPGAGWRPRPRPELLRVAVGVRAGGEPAVLDLKEAAEGGMGPHGLVVGATGSGKSELLRSLVVGLALTHPPELLGFVLVDYKGGAAFAGLAGLPHCAGLVTNLQDDLAMVERMRDALQGELQRRQRLLRRAGDLDGIRQYQARRAADPALPPLPRLVVVVDEFGELLAARPDLAELFVAVGRVGRSLGVQLLLASQRLDEGRLRGLESHLSYRVCLRTFNAAESRAVLGTADAFRLPSSPGLAWLKVDPTLYHSFRVALLHPSGRPAGSASNGPPSVLRFDPFAWTGHGDGQRADHCSGRAGPAPRSLAGAAGGGPPGDAERGEGTTGAGEVGDLEAAVTALAAEGARTGRAVHQVWLPPLPAAVTLDRVLVPDGVGPASPGEPGWLRVPVGLVDRPLAQAQQPLPLDFSAAAGHLAVVGAPRSGKSTLLCALVAAFALTHRPEDVQFYAIDLGGGLLHQLAGLPHVGAVCGRGQAEHARRLVDQLLAVVAERGTGSGHGGRGTEPAWWRRPAAGGHGEVFLLVDNWALLRQLGEDVEAGVGELATGGLHHGVHLVVTANRWADLRPAVRDNLGGRLELRLNDPVESEVGRAAAATLPALPGRGLTAAGLQFQAALPRLASTAATGTGTGAGRTAAGELAAAVASAVTGRPAPPLRLLPALLRADQLPGAAPGEPRGVPFALDEQRLAPVRLDLLGGRPHFLVLGDAGCGKTGLLRLLARGLAERHAPDQVQLVLVDYRRSSIDLAGGPHLAGYACNAGMAAEVVGWLGGLLADRLPAFPAGGRLTAHDRWSGPRYVLLVDDYDLTVGAAGSPLASLLDLLGHGRDVGLHLVLARPVGGTARASFEPVFQRLRELGTPGLVMRGDPQEGPVLGGRRAGPHPPGRGHLVRHDVPDLLVQVALAPPVPVEEPAPVPVAAR